MTATAPTPVIEELRERVNSNDWLVHRGRFVETTFMLERGSVPYLIHIHAGRIETIYKGPFALPQWTFALRASDESWDEFWQAQPKPGFHDLMAMIKFRTLKLEGQPQPFIANLLYFKDVLASLRRQR
jgi:hypothetical protein